MQRRSFLRHTLTAGAALAALGPRRLTAQTAATGGARPFSLGYAPHPGMFSNLAGPDVIDQIAFAAEQGFTAWEDNGMPGRPPAEQEAIGAALASHGMQMGVFVAFADFESPAFTVPDEARHAHILERMQHAVEVAQRCGARWFTVVPGTVDQQAKSDENWNRYGGARLAPGFQTAHAIELLRRCAAVLEPHGLTMVLEPLNWFANHGGVWLQHSDQAYAVCKAVDSPSCKILFDIYHQQISEGNLIPNIDRCWDEIAYFQCGDNPGRKEPGTGEINYRNVFAHLRTKGWDGIVGMEHGKSLSGAEGEHALLRAYREADRP